MSGTIDQLTLATEFWHEFWEGDFEKNGKRRFEEYYAEVRSLVPSDNLLEYRMGDGWQPLCDFLGVPTPPADMPFPHTNDTDGFVSRCRRRNRMQMLNVLFRAAVMLVVLALLLEAARVTLRQGFALAAFARSVSIS